MFTIGDLVIYSVHGICRIDNICDKTISDVTRKYYELHPVDGNHRLAISVPVDSDKVLLTEIMDQEKAHEILELFKVSDLVWNEKQNERNHTFTNRVRSGDRIEIAKVINTLLRKKIEFEKQGKKLFEQDRRILNQVQPILFKELAVSLNTSIDKINKTVMELLKESEAA